MQGCVESAHAPAVLLNMSNRMVAAREIIRMRIKDEVDAFFKLWRERRFLAILFLIIVMGVAIYFVIAWVSQGRTIASLKEENSVLLSEKRDIERDNRQLEIENKGLRDTVAPLIARAAKEFPGEEINISLKKIVDRLENQNPLRQPIASATANVILTIKSDNAVSSHYMDRGGGVAFAQGNSALLTASSYESWGNQMGNGEVRYTGNFTMAAVDPALGKPIEFLKQAQYIQIEFVVMPENSTVTGGKVIFVINGSMRLEFDIPKQQSNGQRVFIRDLAVGLKPLISNN
jgi:hypothetical protein